MLHNLLSLTMFLVLSTGDVPAAPEVAPAPAAVERAICPLTGLPGDPELAQRNPLAVMVENTRKARPQSGLDQAEVVFEVHVEGGVTRFMGLFGCTDAEIIGPVRSTRQVFASWAHSIRAFLGHCWAKPSGYDTIKRLKVRNIDGVRLRGVTTPYHRVDARPKPHNLYTSTAELRRYAAEKEYEPRALVTPLFSFKAPTPATEPTHPWIGLDFNGLTYFSSFAYDAETNRYLRSMAGKPHALGSVPAERPDRQRLDGAAHTEASAQQLAVDNVLVLFMRESVAGPKGILAIRTTGEGRAVLFRDGVMVEGRWLREREGDAYQLLTADGGSLDLNRGKTWIASLPDDEKLVFVVPKRYGKRIEGPTGE